MKIKVIGVILLFISIITIVVSCMMFDLNTKYHYTTIATLLLGILGLCGGLGIIGVSSIE